MAYSVYYFCFQCQERREPKQGMNCEKCGKELQETCEQCGLPSNPLEGEGCQCEDKTDDVEFE